MQRHLDMTGKALEINPSFHRAMRSQGGVNDISSGSSSSSSSTGASSTGTVAGTGNDANTVDNMDIEK